MSFDTLAQSFALIAQWESIAALAIGLVAGVIGGAIPGMSATMAVAITLPFTFALAPITGILLLLGVYKGGIFGGSIPAILIKTPGTPASSATTLDGYPMAERGEAGRALTMALYASCIADFVSNLALILAAGWLASLALGFGPPEIFTLILFSLTIIAGVSGDSLLKGVVSGLLGLLLATVGLDQIVGTDRFSYGDANLQGGLNFIAVLVGLFALPEVFAYLYRPSERAGRVRAVGGSTASWADLRRCLPSILRGSGIGVVMGSIPGIGAAPAAFLAYSEARRTSPRKAHFGKGEIEGVAAAEAGNNGVAGATLIPLLALGVPGDVITAIIIGAFQIHNLQPGPLLFQTNGALVYAIFLGLMLSSALLLVIGFIATRGFRLIAEIPKAIVMPSVLVLSVFGVYAVNNNTFDIGVMFLMGLVGYAFLLLRVPAAPFLIAFILGPLLETNFRLAILDPADDFWVFFRSPITWVFWSLTALSLVFVLTGLRRGGR